jgi:hypothetical protein
MRFVLKQTLDRIDNLMKNNPNTSELKFLLNLRAQLAQKLQELDQETCGFCKKPCGNEHCSFGGKKCQK